MQRPTLPILFMDGEKFFFTVKNIEFSKKEIFTILVKSYSTSLFLSLLIQQNKRRMNKDSDKQVPHLEM